MIGFDEELVTLKLDDIIPVKKLTNDVQKTDKFKQIIASVKEIGIIEPPAVTRNKGKKGSYILLDGHLRVEAMKILGATEISCLISKDDECYTYNKHISRLSTVQEHHMILQAIKRGVSEEKIAAALNVNPVSIRTKRNLLRGICPEAVEMLKDKQVAMEVFRVLRKMKPVRQIETAQLMNDACNYTVSYAQALFGATPSEQLVDPSKPKKVQGLDDHQMARMEEEMAKLQKEYELIEDSYGKDVLHLTLIQAYLGKLLSNAHIVRYLAKHYSDFLAQFQKITELTSLGGSGKAA